MSGVRSKEKKKQDRVRSVEALLDTALLYDENALETALGVLEGDLTSPTVDRGSLLTTLLQNQSLFVFVLSGMSSDGASTVEKHISSVFPVTALAFEDSFASALLEALPQCFQHLDFTPSDFGERNRSVQMIRPALEALANLNLPSDPENTTIEGSDFKVPSFTKWKKQHDGKNRRAGSAAFLVDKRLFTHLNVDPPTSVGEAIYVERQLLDDLKYILMDYLSVFRKEELRLKFKEAALSLLKKSVPHPYSVVQPMKAALYFGPAEGFGNRHIFISSKGYADLRGVKRADEGCFEIYLKKIRELSNGRFLDDCLAGLNDVVPIFKAENMAGGDGLVYHIDYIKEYEDEDRRQVIRIFGVYSHVQLQNREFWTNVAKYLSNRWSVISYTGHLSSLMTLLLSRSTNTYAPATFSLNDLSGASADSSDLRAEILRDLHSLLVLEKYIPFSQALLNSILADQDVAHVFHMTPIEQDIVRYDGSCYVRGRSGTGKTTTMLFKMVGIEHSHVIVRTGYSGELPRPRQLFVTQSRVLAEKVQEYYVKLSMSQTAAHMTAEESMRLAAEQKDPERRVLVDKDEEEFHHGTLPKSFGDLKDEHFPLFITYDQLCRMLEGSDTQVNRPVNAQHMATPTAKDYMLQQRTYIKFLSEYWPCFTRNISKDLDPALVFAEFMGIIQGSEESVSTERGYIDQETYLNVARRQQGTFTTQRDSVYQLFEEYLRMKQRRGEWDAADRTHKILRRINDEGVPGTKVDLIYVDEVQDNLMIDALLMRKLCKNPDGLFWAGDTAQTISAGSSFRFEALKAFMHRVENSSFTPLAKPPREFQLTANFRSHGGIVNAAYSIVKLITMFWPQAIDTLSEERAGIDGAKPIFFTGWDEDAVQFEQSLYGVSGSQIEFGASQCILVRDEAARDRLEEKVGDIGTVLTLYESKGLEFNDVLLYNFFEDSTVSVGQWRVILNALPFRDGINLDCPMFDSIRHSGVCRELKFLYVAITRARQNVWITDCSDKSEPLRMLWDAQGLVETRSTIADVTQLASTSTLEEWEKTARTLFDNKRYNQASRAFTRAKMWHERDIARAYQLREMAQCTPRSDDTVPNSREQAFLTAAEAFYLCAGVSPSRTGRLAHYRIAAECYLEALELKKSAEAYILAEEYTKAAQVFRQGGFFEQAIDTIDRYGEHIPLADAEKIRDVAKIHYSKKQDLDQAMKLFSGVAEALEFMDDFGFTLTKIALLEREGRLREAAEIHLAERRTLDAIRLLMHDLSSKESRACLEDSLLKGIRQQLSFGIPLAGGPVRFRLKELLALAWEAASHGSFSARTLDEFALSQTVMDNDTVKLRELADKFALSYKDPKGMVMCLDYVFQTCMELKGASADAVTPILESFSAYAHELREILGERNPLECTTLRRLFGFYPAPEIKHRVVIPIGTLLHGFIADPENRWARPVSASDGGFTVFSWRLSKIFSAAVRRYFLLKIQEENSACLEATAFRLCPILMILRPGELPNSKHLDRCSCSHNPQDMTVEALHQRFRMLLQQIQIYQYASVLGEKRRIFAIDRRRWISRLYEAYFPVYPKAGSALRVDLARIPEADKGFQTIREWIHDLLLSERFDFLRPWFFLTFIAEVATLALRLEKSKAFDYFKRAPCITLDKPEQYLRNGERYVVQDLLDFLGRRNTASLTAGVIFIKTVCDKRLPIDANVLCHMVELLCSAFVVGLRLRRQGSLHDVTLTRGLLSRLYADNGLKHQSSSAVVPFVELMPTLLREMYSGSFGFLHHNQSLRFDYRIRHIFVMRICKSFTLLGYNIYDPKLHSKILHNMASFKEDTKSNVTHDYPAIFKQYVNATSWDELVRAVRNTGTYEKNSPEELIRLRDASRIRGPQFEVFGTRSIVYRKIGDIPALLWGGGLLGPSLPQTIPNPEPSSSEQTGNDQPAELEPDISVTADENDAELGHDAVLETEEEERDVYHEQRGAIGPTPEEIRVATRLARVYRIKVADRQSSQEKGTTAEYNRIYQSYLESPMVEGMPRRYKLLFLGPLPLSFLCLRTMATIVAEKKAKAKDRMSVGSHSGYERVSAQIKLANELTRRIRGLQNQLDPKSEFHHRQSETELKAYVQEIEDIAAKYPPMISGVEWELKTAVKGILKDPAPPKRPVTHTKPKKPELIIDFDDYEVEDLYPSCIATEPIAITIAPGLHCT
ncbi:hypothetical protein BDY19DRAFT_1047690 [Irpex rosettiformis]|uniref:Uncharacterized protein n=1 Tax=Irpex rosettiformis TaxID=378272 RepID=A0ACB8U6P2_9APHY|nr:hypothetical protein BDY19DRAFT_1047690 [Irpex rosettiformis]